MLRVHGFEARAACRCDIRCDRRSFHSRRIAAKLPGRRSPEKAPPLTAIFVPAQPTPEPAHEPRKSRAAIRMNAQRDVRRIRILRFLFRVRFARPRAATHARRHEKVHVDRIGRMEIRADSVVRRDLRERPRTARPRSRSNTFLARNCCSPSSKKSAARLHRLAPRIVL